MLSGEKVPAGMWRVYVSCLFSQTLIKAHRRYLFLCDCAKCLSSLERGFGFKYSSLTTKADLVVRIVERFVRFRHFDEVLHVMMAICDPIKAIYKNPVNQITMFSLVLWKT